ncbi:MAG: lipoyl protein ligase domain-containing protein [Ilumatobacteraceae bacterium]
MHAKDLQPERGIWNVAISDDALVLGSSQNEDVVDLEACAQANVAVAHRRTGGGVVYLAATEHLWVDVVVPRGDDLWNDDVVISSWWLGEVWSRVLTSLGQSGLSVHRGGLEPATWSKLVCFAGVGPGEVLINGRKVVGISQRRTRQAARFQCFVHRRWRPERFVPLLAKPRPSVAEIRDLVAVVDYEPAQLFAAFVTELNKLQS